jgi:hypothetical protein
MQIATRPYAEATGFSIGHAYQQLTDFHRRLPPIVQADLDSGGGTFNRSAFPPLLEKPIVTATRDRIW